MSVDEEEMEQATKKEGIVSLKFIRQSFLPPFLFAIGIREKKIKKKKNFSIDMKVKATNGKESFLPSFLLPFLSF